MRCIFAAGVYAGSCICFLFPDYAFVAAYYVRPEFRGRGIGSQLFNLVVNNKVKEGNVGLYAEPSMAPVYEEKLGFNKKVSWTAQKVQVTNIDFSKLSGLAHNFLIKDISEISLQQLVEYDSKFAGANRESFVRSWVYERPDAASKVK
ncbi:unnamed protein product [Gongylonema pulchrum]|uniref:N-acetyltransferase domain-containing protein n=1 Tax=Gongylonema pulchrum TaxID=637853 RepID=A0A183D7W8_9BILA|nr:unnamed protein product [Gongylonema pulchrum]